MVLLFLDRHGWEYLKILCFPFCKTTNCLSWLIFSVNIYVVPKIIFKRLAYWSRYCNFHAFNWKAFWVGVKSLKAVAMLFPPQPHSWLQFSFLLMWKGKEAGSAASDLRLNWEWRWDNLCLFFSFKDNCYFHYRRGKRVLPNIFMLKQKSLEAFLHWKV